MDIPQPPQDEELRNIIEKLAIFVARNGSEFETMTKLKQQGNPRFSFLYGGEFYNYYMYRVSSEQAVLKHKATVQQQRQQQGQGNVMGMNAGPNFGPNIGGSPQQQQQPNFGSGIPPLHQQRPRFAPPSMFDPQQQQGPPGTQGPPPRHISRFDRGPAQMQNFERPPMRMPFQPQQQQNFDGFTGGNFDRGPPGGGGPTFPDFQGRHQEGGPPGPAGPNPFDINRGPAGLAGPGPCFPQKFSHPNQHAPSPGNNSTPLVRTPPPMKNLNIEIESLKTQKQALEDQIRQSEKNLAGQHQVLMTQQQQQIDESIRIVQGAEIQQVATELNVNLVELDEVLQPIIDNCTKDSISGGKAWIFTHTSTPKHYELLSMFLLRKTTDPEASFSQRLHIIYLVNDVLHHCMRKGAEDLQQVLEAMVIPMFCHAKVKEVGNEENLVKLNKLLTLWETKSQYVSPAAVEKLRDANNTWLEYHSVLLKRHAVVVTQIAQNTQKTYEGYQGQHQIFCQHVLQNIKTMDQQIQQLLLQQQFQLAQQQQQQQQQINLNLRNPSLMGGPPPGTSAGIQNIPPPGLVIPGNGGPLIPSMSSSVPPNIPMTTGYPGQGPPTGFMQKPPNHQPPPSLDNPPNVPIPDISRPPPGFQQPISEKELMPALPYYELPAGLMVPLVKPEDDNYKPIDPKSIRLPPPCPPSERLLAAVEAFYGLPSHERPRDSEGWERLGLYEYFKSKNLARKQKEDDIREGRRDKSKSPSPLRRDSSPSGRSPPRRRYQSKSPTPHRRRRSRSRSPSRKLRRRRSRSRSPGRRSPSPPSFTTAGLGIDTKLDESNKGHQLLKKMGWGGSGLGANEQGIEAPISGGEIRERKDLYKGVGISVNDPFESYRKSKGQAFVERMRQRAEERP